jgi:hypothetical protein
VLIGKRAEMVGFFLIVILVLAVSVLFDLAIARFSGSRMTGYVVSLLSTLLGLPPVIIFVSEATDIFHILVALGFGLMWWFIYLNVAQAVESSLRIRMLLEISDNGGTLPLEQLKTIYSDDKLIRLRLNRLTQGGAVVRENDRWYLRSAKLRTAAHFFTSLKRSMLGKGSQFEVR